MRNMTLLAAGAMALGGFCVQHASSAVYSFDDFEGKHEPLGAPDIGIGYSKPSAFGSPHSLSTAPAPAIGTTSLKLIRDGLNNPNSTVAQGLEGALVAGTVIEFSWSHQVENVHTLNGPVQVGLGLVSGGAGRLTTINIGDAGSSGPNGRYNYIDSSGSAVLASDISTGAPVYASRNSGAVGEAQTAWDTIRAVIALQSFQDSGTDYLTGTMDLFITRGLNGVEQQVANDAQLGLAVIPADDDDTPFNEMTVPMITIQKGPSSGSTYYDNIFIGNPGSAIPEPSSLALGAGFGLLALRRRRR